MNARSVLHLIGSLLVVMGLAQLACWGVALGMGDPASTLRALVLSGGLALAVGLLTSGFTRGAADLSRRDGYLIVTCGWLAAAGAGALPYIFSGIIPNPVSALFESMSGLTTTGASVIADVEAVPKGILLWRAMTHWFGGMGVLVLCVAIMAFLGVGGMQLYRAEMPGPSKDRLTPRITSTAKLLWSVYVLFCAVEMVLLRLAGMTWFDAVCQAFATMATGGFSTKNASIGAYNSPLIEAITMIFMFLAGVNFALHFRALRGQPLVFWKDPEFLVYASLTGAVCLALTLITRSFVYDSWLSAFRATSFTTISILTTTGFATADFNGWPDSAQVLLMLLMFIGGCAGSTAGGMKVARVFILARLGLREVFRFVHPQAVVSLKIGRKTVDETVITNVAAFFVLYMLIFVGASALMCAFMPNLISAVSSVAATLGNIGPGFGAVGPTQTYAGIPAAGKGILIVCMLLGRLELYTVLVLFLPRFWKT